MNTEELLKLLRKKRREIDAIVFIMRVLLATLFAIFYYLLITYFLTLQFFSLINLAYIVRFLKIIIIILSAFLIASFAMFSSRSYSSELHYLLLLIAITTILSFILGLSDEDIRLLMDYEALSEFLKSNLISIVYGAMLVLFIVSMLLTIGFLRRGMLDHLITSMLLIYFAIIGIFLFSPNLIFAIKLEDLFTLRGILHTLLSLQFLPFLLTFLILEIGQFFNSIHASLIPLKNRFKRMENQLRRVERAQREITGIIGHEEFAIRRRIIEVLSPLISSIIRDAYEGYAFLGEGTALYVDSKVKAYVEFSAKKDELFLIRVAGLHVDPLTKSMFLSLIISLLGRIIMTIGVLFTAFFLLGILLQTNFSKVYEMNRFEAYVFMIFVVLILAYFMIMLIERLMRKRLEKGIEIREYEI